MSAETKSGGLPHKYLLHTIIMVALTFGFRLLPCPGSVTPYGMEVLGVFVGLVYGWTFLGLLGPSLFGAIVMGTTDYGSVQDVFVAMFSNSTVLMMLVGILAFAAIEQTGAGDWLIAKLLNSKIAKKSPIFIVEIFLFIFYLGNIIGLCWFLYFAMLPLCAEMLLKCGYEKGDRFNLFFLAGCLIFGQIGMTLFPFLGWSLMTVGTMMQLTQTMISYPQYMAIMAIFGILSFITYPFLMKICGCKFDKLATVDIQTAFPNVKADAKLTVAQNLSIWSVVLFVVFVIAASMFGKNIAFLSYINTKIGVLGLMAILWVFIVMFQTNGKPLLDMRKAAAGNIGDNNACMGVGGVYHFTVSDIDSDVTAVPKSKPRRFGERVNRTFFDGVLKHRVCTDVGHTVCAVFDSPRLGVQPAVAFNQSDAVRGSSAVPVCFYKVCLAADLIGVLLGF